MKKTLGLALALTLVGCATPNTGIVNIGSGNYMLSKWGSFTQFSGAEVKVELFKEAGEFCAKQGKQLDPGSSTSKDSGYGIYATAEIQFRCR